VSPDDQYCGELTSHPFELRTTVEHAIAQFAGAAGKLDLISHLAEDCPAMVIGDVARLRQVLGTLVGNAVRFTAHGDVLLRVELDIVDPAHTDQVRLRFTVADTGIGIPPEQLDGLFHGGPGGGLPISKAIVEAMGGRLTVTSGPGGGAEFTFGVVLGRCDEEAVRRPPVGITELARLADRNVLVVVDDETDRQILRRTLESFGMVCTASASPLDAVDLIGGGRSFDIAILDGATPVATPVLDGAARLLDGAAPVLDGVQLALVLRRLPAGRRLPLVLLSGVEGPDRDDALFAAVLTGPIDRLALFLTITRILCPDPGTDPPFSSRPSQPSQPSPESQPSLPIPDSQPSQPSPESQCLPSQSEPSQS
jgi:CheY-like chemotaxis protein